MVRRVELHRHRWFIGPGASVMDAQIGRNSRLYFVIGLTVLTMVYSAAVLTVKFLFL